MQGEKRLSKRKQEHREKRDARRSRRKSRRQVVRSVVFTIVVAVALALIGGLLLPSVIPSGGGAADPLTADKRAAGPGDHFDDQGREHIAEGVAFPSYNSLPPTSGPHWAVPAGWGIFKAPIPNERQVHSLEHGGVLMQYNTDDSKLIQEIEELAQDITGFPACIVVAPYPEMENTIAITAWGVRLTMETFDRDSIRDFARFYRDEGPEQIRCSDVTLMQ